MRRWVVSQALRCHAARGAESGMGMRKAVGGRLVT